MAHTTPHGLEWRRDRIVPWSELTFRSDPSGGPGGQHANRSSTRVHLYWNPGQSSAFNDSERQAILQHLTPRLTRDGILRLRSGSERSLSRNKRECLDRLAELIREALTPRRPRRPTRPTRASRERRLGAKRQRSQQKKLRRPVRRDED